MPMPVSLTVIKAFWWSLSSTTLTAPPSSVYFMPFSIRFDIARVNFVASISAETSFTSLKPSVISLFAARG